MKHQNLFARIQGTSGEDLAMEVLTDILRDPVYLKPFLELIGSAADPAAMSVECESGAGSGRRAISITAAGGGEVIRVEKGESAARLFRLWRSADLLRQSPCRTERLIFLARGDAQACRLKAAIAQVEQCVPDKSGGASGGNKTIVSIVTWERLFGAWDAAAPKDGKRSFLAETLREFLFPAGEHSDPEIDAFAEKETWERIERAIRCANTMILDAIDWPYPDRSFPSVDLPGCGRYDIRVLGVENREAGGYPSARPYRKFLCRSDLWGVFEWGADLNHCLRWKRAAGGEFTLGHPFFFVIKMPWKDTDMMERIKHHGLSEQILLECGFTKFEDREAQTTFYLRPLPLGDVPRREILQNDSVSAFDHLARCVLRIIDDLNEAVAALFLGRNDSPFGKTENAVRQWCADRAESEDLLFRENEDGFLLCRGGGEDVYRFRVTSERFGARALIELYLGGAEKAIGSIPCDARSIPEEIRARLNRLFEKAKKEGKK